MLLGGLFPGLAPHIHPIHREPNMRKRKLKRIEVKRDSWRTAAVLFEATQSILQLALRNYRANLWVRQTLACAPPRPAGFAARVHAVRIVDFTVGARHAEVFKRLLIRLTQHPRTFTSKSR